MPDLLLAAARIVLEEYGGNAARLWSDEPSAPSLNSVSTDFRALAR